VPLITRLRAAHGLVPPLLLVAVAPIARDNRHTRASAE